LTDVAKRSIDVEVNKDPTARLHARESIMVDIGLTNHSIQVIRFSHEWAEVSCQPGGKAWKTKYRLDAFETFHKDFLSTDYTPAEYKHKLKTFTSRHEKVIKARCKLFVQVFFKILSLYALTILLIVP
jgi:hypothetical protein